MIDKKDLEAFLTMLSALDERQLKTIFNKGSLRELLFTIDIDREMTTFKEFLNSISAGDRIRVKDTGETGIVLYCKDDKINVVMDAFTNIEEQVKTFNIIDVEKRAV